VVRSVIVVDEVVVVVKVASLSSVEFEDFTMLVVVDFLNSSICLEASKAAVVGLGPVIGARPDGVSARIVK